MYKHSRVSVLLWCFVAGTDIILTSAVGEKANQIFPHLIKFIEDKQSDQHSSLAAWWVVWNCWPFIPSFSKSALEIIFYMESHMAEKLADLLAACDECDIAAIEELLLQKGMQITSTVDVDEFKKFLIESSWFERLPNSEQQRFYKRLSSANNEPARMVNMEVQTGSKSSMSSLIHSTSRIRGLTLASTLLNQEENCDDNEYRHPRTQHSVDPSSVGATGGTTRTGALDIDSLEKIVTEIVGISEDSVSSNAGNGDDCSIPNHGPVSPQIAEQQNEIGSACCVIL
jgi:hypothetical protein